MWPGGSDAYGSGAGVYSPQHSPGALPPTWQLRRAELFREAERRFAEEVRAASPCGPASPTAAPSPAHYDHRLPLGFDVPADSPTSAAALFAGFASEVSDAVRHLADVVAQTSASPAQSPAAPRAPCLCMPALTHVSRAWLQCDSSTCEDIMTKKKCKKKKKKQGCNKKKVMDKCLKTCGMC